MEPLSGFVALQYSIESVQFASLHERRKSAFGRSE